ncbi:MAG: cytidine deaminase [Rhodospirillales bacterium]|nr:cytidine deaminase [Rhodospirillales bacterium]
MEGFAIRAPVPVKDRARALRRLAEEARALADPPVSGFRVGAAIIGARTGRVYLGGNVEFPGAAISQTVHAEQAAFASAWHHGETGIASMAVSAMPCGHCRQFLFETLAPRARPFQVTVGRRTQTLAELLPDAFGPQDLGLPGGSMSTRPVRLSCKGDRLVQAARKAAGASYAPHTRAHAGIALLLADDAIVTGRYAENAAFNPGLAPLQSALILRDLAGKRRVPIERAVLVARAAAFAHAARAEELLAIVAPGVRLETVYAR